MFTGFYFSLVWCISKCETAPVQSHFKFRAGKKKGWKTQLILLWEKNMHHRIQLNLSNHIKLSETKVWFKKRMLLFLLDLLKFLEFIFRKKKSKEKCYGNQLRVIADSRNLLHISVDHFEDRMRITPLCVLLKLYKFGC